MNALECRCLSVHYGRFKALDDFTHAFQAGRLYGIIGPNGAGKTTLFKAMTGEASASAGTIRYREQDITRLPTHEVVALGVALAASALPAWEAYRVSVFELLQSR